MVDEQPVEKVLVTVRDDAPKDGTTTTMPTVEGEKEVEVVAMRWWTQVLVRGGRSYVQNVLGYLLTAGIGATIANAVVALLVAVGLLPTILYAAEQVATATGVPPNAALAFGYVLLSAMSAAVGPTFVCLAQNWLEISAGWDASNPKFRA